MFAYRCYIILAPFVVKTIFYPLNCFYNFVGNKLLKYMWVSSWIICSPLIWMERCASICLRTGNGRSGRGGGRGGGSPDLQYLLHFFLSTFTVHNFKQPIWHQPTCKVLKIWQLALMSCVSSLQHYGSLLFSTTVFSIKVALLWGSKSGSVVTLTLFFFTLFCLF